MQLLISSPGTICKCVLKCRIFISWDFLTWTFLGISPLKTDESLVDLPLVSPRQLQRHRGGGDYPLQLPSAQGEGQSQQQLQLGLAGEHLLVIISKTTSYRRNFLYQVRCVWFLYILNGYHNELWIHKYCRKPYTVGQLNHCTN